MRIYSANEVTFNFLGLSIESGRGDDEFVRIEKEEDAFTAKAGIDGEVTRSESKNNIHRVTVTLMQSSKGNDLLSAIHNGDIKIPGGSGVGPAMVRDRQGTSICVDPEAFITKFPDQSFSKEAGTVEWVFIFPNPERFVGGN